MKDRWFTLYCEPGHLGTGRHNDAIRKAVGPPQVVGGGGEVGVGEGL